jgi:hypothetical protein
LPSNALKIFQPADNFNKNRFIHSFRTPGAVEDCADF